MNEFKFTGDWVYDIRLPTFAGFQSRKGPYTSRDQISASDGSITLEIDDQLDDSPDPTDAQIKAIEYLFTQQESLREAIISALVDNLPNIFECYELHLDDPSFMDCDATNIHERVGFSTVTIYTTVKEGMAYFEFNGGCDWDEEHGLGILLHGNRVIEVGAEDGNGHWKARKDAGLPEESYDPNRLRPEPKKFKPHPKYGKLKPKQASKNNFYEVDLARFGFTKQLKAAIESGDIDVQQEYSPWNKTLMQIAAEFGNDKSIILLYEHGASLRGTIPLWAHRGRSIHTLDILLKMGANINDSYEFQRTALYIVAKELVNNYTSVTNFRKQNFEPDTSFFKRMDDLRHTMNYLIEQGADKYTKDQSGTSVVQLGRNLSTVDRIEFERCLKVDRKTSTENTKARPPEKSWWKRLF